MVTIVVISLTVLVAALTTSFLFWRRKKLAEAQEQIRILNTQRDTARMVEEYKRKKVEETWEEFDRRQWDLRANLDNVE
jgi:uncharacterized membrane protein (DUF106 family)